MKKHRMFAPAKTGYALRGVVHKKVWYIEFVYISAPK